MNLRKINRRILIVLIFLLVALFATSVLLGLKFSEIASTEQNIIVIAPNVTDKSHKPYKTSKNTNNTQQPTTNTQTTTTPTYIYDQNAESTILAYDNNKIWSTKTDVEIFKMQYQEDGSLTVKSSNGDKIIAPGTEGEYTFHFKNESDAPARYNMKLEAIFSQTEWPIPIQARMKNHDGEYIIGGEDWWDDSLDLDVVKDSAILDTNKYVTYTFEWRWPFEHGDGDDLIANDEYDTFLGDYENLFDKEMSMKIEICTYTELDYTVDSNTEEVHGSTSPYTGEIRSLAIRSAIVMMSLVSSIIIIICLERKRIEKNGKLATKKATNDTENEDG